MHRKLCHTALLLLFLLYCQVPCLADTSPPEGTASSSPDQTTDAQKRVWTLPRISTYARDLYDFDKYCPDTPFPIDFLRPNFKGQKVKCVHTPSDNDNSMNDVLTRDKTNILRTKIIPNITATLSARVFVRPNERPLKLPTFSSDSVCSQFYVPKSHQSDGVLGADIVMYIAAGPMSENDTNTPVWVQQCPTSDNANGVALVLNFNPRNITNHENMIEATMNAINKALGTSDCAEEEKLLLKTKKGDSNTVSSLACINVKCTDKSKVEVKHINGTDWTECNSEFVLNSTGSSESVVCPRVEEVCKPTEHKVTNISLSSEWKTIKFITSALTLDDDAKHLCSNFSNETVVKRSDVVDFYTMCNSTDKKSANTYGLPEENKTIILNTIIPEIVAMNESAPLVRPLNSSETIPVQNDSICSKLKIPESQTHGGVPNTDIALYIAAVPFVPEHVKLSVWVEPCAKNNGRVVSAAVLFNTRKDLSKDTNTITSALKNRVEDVIWSGKCSNEKGALLLPAKTMFGTPSSACLSVRCTSNSQVHVRRNESSEWKTCESDMEYVIMDRFLRVPCPKFADVCLSIPSTTQDTSTPEITSEAKSSAPELSPAAPKAQPESQAQSPTTVSTVTVQAPQDGAQQGQEAKPGTSSETETLKAQAPESLPEAPQTQNAQVAQPTQPKEVQVPSPLQAKPEVNVSVTASVHVSAEKEDKTSEPKSAPQHETDEKTKSTEKQEQENVQNPESTHHVLSGDVSVDASQPNSHQNGEEVIVSSKEDKQPVPVKDTEQQKETQKDALQEHNKTGDDVGTSNSINHTSVAKESFNEQLTSPVALQDKKVNNESQKTTETPELTNSTDGLRPSSQTPPANNVKQSALKQRENKSEIHPEQTVTSTGTDTSERAAQQTTVSAKEAEPSDAKDGQTPTTQSKNGDIMRAVNNSAVMYRLRFPAENLTRKNDTTPRTERTNTSMNVPTFQSQSGNQTGVEEKDKEEKVAKTTEANAQPKNVPSLGTVRTTPTLITPIKDQKTNKTQTVLASPQTPEDVHIENKEINETSQSMNTLNKSESTVTLHEDGAPNMAHYSQGNTQQANKERMKQTYPSASLPNAGYGEDESKSSVRNVQSARDIPSVSTEPVPSIELTDGDLSTLKMNIAKASSENSEGEILNVKSDKFGEASEFILKARKSDSNHGSVKWNILQVGIFALTFAIIMIIN